MYIINDSVFMYCLIIEKIISTNCRRTIILYNNKQTTDFNFNDLFNV